MTFLGTGGSIPSVDRNLSSTALQIGSEVLLFDCGEGTQRQIMASKLSFMKISRIFITHLHGDHFLGVIGLIQSMSFNGREHKLEVYGPNGVIQLIQNMLSMGYFQPGFDIGAGEMEDGTTLEFDGYAVTAVSVDHAVPGLGYVFQEEDRPGRFNLEKAKELEIPEGPLYARLQQGESVTIDGKEITPDMVLGPRRRGRKIVFSGDTSPSESLIEAARGADVLVHEATVDSSLEEKAHKYGHSTAGGAARVAKRAGVHRLFLNHISNRYEDVTVLEEEAREVFPNSSVCSDLETFTVRTRD